MAHRKKKWRSSDIQLADQYDFTTLVQNKKVLRGLLKAGFQKPSPIQVEGIPKARLGKDLIIQAKSGTGKTLVFAIAILERLKPDNKLQALVLTPTREIAAQVQSVIYDIGTEFIGLKCEYFIGGTPVQDDAFKVEECQIAIGTPGRILDLIEQSIINLSTVHLCILDEADKLFEVGDHMCRDVKSIIDNLGYPKQILAVSATSGKGDFSELKSYMKDPKHINLAKRELSLKGVTQYFGLFKKEFDIEEPNSDSCFPLKFNYIKTILQCTSFSQCFIFAKNRRYVQLYSDELQRWGFPVTTMYGAAEQTTRLLTLQRLKSNRIKILVTTDLSARGIDVENVNLVIHVDIANDLETYLHRVGRAGRYGTRGVSVALVSSGREVERLADYIMRANLSVYPLPSPLPYKLSKYNPPSSEAKAVLEYIRYSLISSKEYENLKITFEKSIEEREDIKESLNKENNESLDEEEEVEESLNEQEKENIPVLEQSQHKCNGIHSLLENLANPFGNSNHGVPNDLKNDSNETSNVKPITKDLLNSASHNEDNSHKINGKTIVLNAAENDSNFIDCEENASAENNSSDDEEHNLSDAINECDVEDIDDEQKEESDTYFNEQLCSNDSTHSDETHSKHVIEISDEKEICPKNNSDNCIDKTSLSADKTHSEECKNSPNHSSLKNLKNTSQSELEETLYYSDYEAVKSDVHNKKLKEYAISNEENVESYNKIGKNKHVNETHSKRRHRYDYYDSKIPQSSNKSKFSSRVSTKYDEEECYATGYENVKCHSEKHRNKHEHKTSAVREKSKTGRRCVRCDMKERNASYLDNIGDSVYEKYHDEQRYINRSSKEKKTSNFDDFHSDPFYEDESCREPSRYCSHNRREFISSRFNKMHQYANNCPPLHQLPYFKSESEFLRLRRSFNVLLNPFQQPVVYGTELHEDWLSFLHN